MQRNTNDTYKLCKPDVLMVDEETRIHWPVCCRSRWATKVALRSIPVMSLASSDATCRRANHGSRDGYEDGDKRLCRWQIMARVAQYHAEHTHIVQDRDDGHRYRYDSDIHAFGFAVVEVVANCNDGQHVAAGWVAGPRRFGRWLFASVNMLLNPASSSEIAPAAPPNPPPTRHIGPRDLNRSTHTRCHGPNICI